MKLPRPTLPIHQDQPTRQAGRPLPEARAALLMVHGRGATAESILNLAGQLEHPEFAYLAPQAANRTWYPHSFLAPIQQNEPNLSSALARLEECVLLLASHGLESERVILLGFSQGACLASEFLARQPRRYGGAAILTGGLIGPRLRDYDGSLQGTPVLLGAGDPDPHVPWQRVEESAEALKRLGARVDVRRYPGLGHSVNRDELEAVRQLMARALKGEAE